MGSTQVWREADLIDFQVRNSLASILGYPPTGKVVYVHSGSGISTNVGSSSASPTTTLALGLAQCSASVGDVVYLMPGHSETLASTTVGVAVATAGVSIIGGGNGRNAPTLTAATSAAIDAMELNAANIRFHNIRWVGATSCTALLDMNSANDCVFTNCVFEHGAAPTDAITVTTASSRCKFIDCVWRGTAAGPDIGILANAAAQDWIFIRPLAQYSVSSGLDEAFIKTSGASSNMSGIVVVNPIIIGADAACVTFDFNTSNLAIGDGLVVDAAVMMTSDTTLTSTFGLDVGGCGFVNYRVIDRVSSNAKTLPITASA